MTQCDWSEAGEAWRNGAGKRSSSQPSSKDKGGFPRGAPWAGENELGGGQARQREQHKQDVQVEEMQPRSQRAFKSRLVILNIILRASGGINAGF